MNVDYFNDKEREKQKGFARLRDAAVAPLLPILKRLGIGPNTITLLGVAALLAGLAAAAINPVWYAVGLVFYVVLDGLDGPVARHQGKSSPIGALADITADQIGVPLVLAYLAYRGMIEGWLAATLSGFYLITIYNMVISNMQGFRMAFTLRLKYVFFALAAAYLLGLPYVSVGGRYFLIAASLYYGVMIVVNQAAATLGARAK